MATHLGEDAVDTQRFAVPRAAQAGAGYAGAPLAFLLALCIGLAVSLTGSAALAQEDVPLAWCADLQRNCGEQRNPRYAGQTPADWEAAAHLLCQRLAAANYAGDSGAACPCDGTTCSTVVSCSLLSKVEPDAIGANSARGVILVHARDARGTTWSSSHALPYCGCPAGAAFTATGECVCAKGSHYAAAAKRCVANLAPGIEARRQRAPRKPAPLYSRSSTRMSATVSSID